MPDWKAIYERHSVVVWRSAWRILHDHDLAAECVQETFLAVMSFSQERNIANWESLLVSIATRRALDQLRARYRSRQRHSSADLFEVCSSSPAPFQNVLSAELADRLRQAVAELPPLQADVFCLRVFNELTYHEIAIQLGLDDQHVGVLLHRARQALQRRLNDVSTAIPKGENHDKHESAG